MSGSILDLASRLSLKQQGREWRGNCPACGYKDGFAAVIGTSGHPIMHCFNGCDGTLLLNTVEKAQGSGWTLPPRPVDAMAQADRVRRQDAAQRLWQCSHPCPGTLSETYLTRRGIGHVATSAALRFHPDCPHPNGNSRPALVSAVRDLTGTMVAVQRTYLASDGRKVTLGPPRATLGTAWGAAVQLEPCGPALVVGEGTESAASAGLLLCLPAWAALSAGNLARGLVLPAVVTRVVIAVDNDRPGQDAAAAAAQRWRAEGRTVELALPDQPGTDFNDLVQAHEMEATRG